VRQFQPVFEEFENVLSPTDAQRLRAALQLTDTSHEGISRAINVLEFELGHVASALPAGGLLGAAIAGAAVIIAAGAGAACVALNASAVQIAVKNNGCDPIQLSQGVLPALDWITGAVGLKLPDRPIAPGAEESISLPPLDLTLAATTDGQVALVVLGRKVPLELGFQVSSIELDGKELLGQTTELDLGAAAQHQLVVSCR
jgi:hypothetical protein